MMGADQSHKPGSGGVVPWGSGAHGSFLAGSPNGLLCLHAYMGRHHHSTRETDVHKCGTHTPPTILIAACTCPRAFVFTILNCLKYISCISISPLGCQFRHHFLSEDFLAQVTFSPLDFILLSLLSFIPAPISVGSCLVYWLAFHHLFSLQRQLCEQSILFTAGASTAIPGWH